MSSTDNYGVADCTATPFFFSNNAQELPEKSGEICFLLDRNMRKKTRERRSASFPGQCRKKPSLKQELEHRRVGIEILCRAVLLVKVVI